MFKKRYCLPLLLSAFLLAGPSCHKDDDEAPARSVKYSWVSGRWTQQDLVISVTVKLGGQTIPEGTSMIQLAPLLGQALGNPAIADALTCTQNNIYTFHDDGSYQIDGCTDLILPNASQAGHWALTVYDAVLQLTPDGGQGDPHWINSIDSTHMHLALTVRIPGVGDAPLGLILEKQP